MSRIAAVARYLFLAAAIAAFAVPPAVTQTPAAQSARGEAAAPRGFAWEAAKDGRRVLLVGTIHVGRAAPPPADCSQRFGQAAVVAFEADVFDARSVGQRVQKIAMYPPQEADLKSRLAAALRERVEALLPRHGPRSSSGSSTARAWNCSSPISNRRSAASKAAKASASCGASSPHGTSATPPTSSGCWRRCARPAVRPSASSSSR